MAISKMDKKFGKDHACDSGDVHMDTDTDVLITILCHRFCGQSNKLFYAKMEHMQHPVRKRSV